MNKIHKRRLWTFVFFALIASLAAALVLYALKQNINVFLTPSQLATRERELPPDYHFRLGGMVKKGSVKREADLRINFIVTDFKHELPVEYTGVLPDLFREGKGVIASGNMVNGRFIATEILAKHDENYMPKNVYKALRENRT